jgi:hypothetical protein
VFLGEVGDDGVRAVPVPVGPREDEVLAVDAGLSLPLNQPIDDLSISYLDGKYNGNWNELT